MDGVKFLSLDRLNVWYSPGKTVLDDLSLELGDHEIVGLIGLNGAGKTTFIKTLSGLIDSYRIGTALWRGAAFSFRDKAFKESRYTVFAEDHSFGYFTFREYLSYAAASYGVKQPDFSELTRGFHFEDYVDVLLKELSTGNLKKAYLMTAFALHPKLLLLDEPVNGLDFGSTEYLYELSACFLWRELRRGLLRRALVRDADDDRIRSLCRCFPFLFDDQNKKHHSRLYLSWSNQRPARSTTVYLRIKLQRFVRPKTIRGHWNVWLFGHWNCTNAFHKEPRETYMVGVERLKSMNVAYVILKILMWVLIVLFAGDFIIQTISYSFYKGDRKLEQVTFQPERIQIDDDLLGYGYALEQESDHVILCFGGSMYVAYNTVGMYGGYYDCPFLSVDYYGTQESPGRMNLQTMQKSAETLYDYVATRYPGKAVIVMGHSYGCGMAAYLAGVRDCSHLILLSGYRTSADMYNRILPFYWGPLQVFIKNNIRVDRYAMKTPCPVTVIGSDADTTLSTELQKKLAGCYADAELMIFSGIRHEDYLTSTDVIQFIKHSITKTQSTALDTE